VACAFDSSALLAMLGNERGGARVLATIQELRQREEPLLITSVNLGEIWYVIAGKHSSELAEAAVSDLRKLGLEVVPADWKLARLAAELKASTKTSYGDCFAAALAMQRGVPVVTRDRGFRVFGKRISVQFA